MTEEEGTPGERDLVATPFPIGVTVSGFELALLDPVNELRLRLFRSEVVEAAGLTFDMYVERMRRDVLATPYLQEALLHLGYHVGTPAQILAITGKPYEPRASVTGIRPVPAYAPPPDEIVRTGPRTLSDGHLHHWQWAGTWNNGNPPVWHVTCACGSWALLGNEMDEASGAWLRHAKRVHDIRGPEGNPIAEESYTYD